MNWLSKRMIYGLFLLFNGFFGTFAENIIYTPANTIIAFDLDDTLIEYNPFYKTKIIAKGLNIFHPLQSLHYLILLNKMRSILKEASPKPIGGATLQFIYAGVQMPTFCSYVPDLIQLMWKNSNFKIGIIPLMSNLHRKGFEIWIATNKDHLS